MTASTIASIATNPEVTIICLAFNHAKFIRECLDSFLAQKDVSFEIIVADDASTDGTTDIVREYADRHPQIVRHFVQTTNVGAEENFTKACQHIRGKYVAMCDGDDYFITDDKLHKQIRILKDDPSLSICFSKARIIYDDASLSDEVAPKGSIIANRSRFNLADLMNTNPIPTCTVVYRWIFTERRVEDHVPRGILPGDYYLHMVHAREGDIAFLDEVTSVYRRHSNGMWWDYDSNWDKQNLKHGIAELKFHLAAARRILSDADSVWYEENRALPFAALLLLLYVRTGKVDMIKTLQDTDPKIFSRIPERLNLN
ncbi:glycosyltransferase [Methylobacterium sp. 285MFTsu5.1]|uniref:glycosyltransferase n=1 Tax=Methylobacterium sp. 285MFTsu5.1 TaxID=1172187 RepID=UPI0009DB8BBD|nr:glycosyltransferase [Methylobacterium sp. 285MFTsu5.1]